MNQVNIKKRYSPNVNYNLNLILVRRMQIWWTTRSAPGTSCMKVRLVRSRCFVLTMLRLKTLASWTV